MAGPWCKGIDNVEREQYLDRKPREGGCKRGHQRDWDEDEIPEQWRLK